MYKYFNFHVCQTSNKYTKHIAIINLLSIIFFGAIVIDKPLCLDHDDSSSDGTDPL